MESIETRGASKHWRMGQDTRVSGTWIMERETAGGTRFGLTGHSMRAIGGMTRQMGEAA